VAKTIQMDLNAKSINRGIKELQKYKAWIERKEAELRIRLATLGATVASIQFARAMYNGTNDVSVRVDDTGSVAVIYAEGEAVANNAGVAVGAGEGVGTWVGVGVGVTTGAIVSAPRRSAHQL